jgi:hypothetical protein
MRRALGPFQALGFVFSRKPPFLLSLTRTLYLFSSHMDNLVLSMYASLWFQAERRDDMAVQWCCGAAVQCSASAIVTWLSRCPRVKGQVQAGRPG